MQIPCREKQPKRFEPSTDECESIGDDVCGVAVHIASRVDGLAEPGEVLVSSAVSGLVAGGPCVH